MDGKWSVLATLRAGREQVQLGGSEGAIGAIRSLRGRGPGAGARRSLFRADGHRDAHGRAGLDGVLRRTREATLALFDAAIGQLAASCTDAKSATVPRIDRASVLRAQDAALTSCRTRARIARSRTCRRGCAATDHGFPVGAAIPSVALPLDAAGWRSPSASSSAMPSALRYCSSAISRARGLQGCRCRSRSARPRSRSAAS